MATNFRPPPLNNAIPIFSMLKRVGMAAKARRRSITFSLAAMACGGLCVVTVASAVGRANAAHLRLGTTNGVVVMTRDVVAGAVIAADDVAVDQRPAGQIPSGAVAEMTAVIGHRSQASLMAKQIVMPGMLRGNLGSPIAAQLPVGTVGVAVPLPAGSLMPSVGDRVDLYSNADVGTASAQRVGSDAEVVSVMDGVAVVAVDQAQVATAAAALLRGQIVLAMHPTN